MKKTIILVCGEMRSGKDSAGEILREMIPNSNIESITWKLKQFIEDKWNLDRGMADEIKDVAVATLKNKETGEVYSEITLRRDLQFDADRSRPYMTCEEGVAKLLEEDFPYYILTGVRLPEEVELIKKIHADKNVIALKVNRTGFENNSPDKNHKTETLVSLIQADFEIEAGSIDSLKDELEVFYNHYLDA